jgi:hypothetical protein
MGRGPKATPEDPQEALVGRMPDHQRFEVHVPLVSIERINAKIDLHYQRLGAALANAGLEPKVQLLPTIPGCPRPSP